MGTALSELTQYGLQLFTQEVVVVVRCIDGPVDVYEYR